METLVPPCNVTVRDPKGCKFISIVEVAYDKEGLSEAEAQCVNDTPGLASLIHCFITENRTGKLYETEEVDSTYGYFSGYGKPKDVAWQSDRLRELFSCIGFHDERAEHMVVPEGAEGLFVIPKWQSFAKLHNVSTYVDCANIVLAKLKETRSGKFCIWGKAEVTSENTRETAWKAKAMAKIAEEQTGYDLLVVPAQFGIMHRGRSHRRARVVSDTKGFCLGVFEVGIMLLLHPERLNNSNDLNIDCSGDEFKLEDGLDFVCSLVFIFSAKRPYHDEGLEFGYGWSYYASEYYGSASAFLSQ